MAFTDIDPLHPVFASLVVAVALATASIFARLFGVRPEQGRFASLDGLRGFLALGVFIQHAAMWYLYLTEDDFAIGTHQLYRHLGEASVGAFFMITALLFTRKVLQGRDRGVDWIGLYVGRAMRLWPLYLVVVAVMLVSIFWMDNWTMLEPPSKLASHLISWLLFTFNGTPQINGFADTDRMIAGVTWTLAYEWLFYLGLPMLAVLVRARPGKWLLAFSVVACGALAASIPFFHLTKLAYFIGGMVAAVCVEWKGLASRLQGPAGSVLTLVCIATAGYFFTTAYRLPPAALFTVAFIPVVCGNTLFGLLTLPASRALGELTYGMYLWHGLALYFLFHKAHHHASALSPLAFWSVVLLITPAMLLLCQVTYRYVEKPFIDSAPRLARWIKARNGTPLPAATRPGVRV
jgi:peptidoglycan/LPS O-acetylase OafA/YrhL